MWKMSEILCSTGALIGRPNNRDYHLLDSLAKQLSCDGFEFMMYSTWYDEVDEIVTFFRESGLHIPVMHAEKHIGEYISKGGSMQEDGMHRFVINCEIANRIGAQKIVVHLWDGITSDSNIQNNMEAYADLQKIAETHQIDLLIENVVCNCQDPMSHWCRLRERYQNVHFIFDTKMAAFHDQLALLYQKEYEWLWREGHIRHFHVNDYAGGFMDWQNLRTLPIGNGNIDFEQFFSYVKKIGYNGTYTVESTAFQKNGSVDTDMLNRQFAYIRNAVR